MTKQLSLNLFKSAYVTQDIPQQVFDENKAKWVTILDSHERAGVMAYIPTDAVTPLEQNYSGPRELEKERKHQLWCQYTSAIQRYILRFEHLQPGDAWDLAYERLLEYRNQNIPCPMDVSRINDDQIDFRPRFVEKYL